LWLTVTYMDPTDKTVIVTGGASGLGRATAELLIARAARVAIVDLDRDRCEAVGAEIGAYAVTADVTDEDAVGAAIAEVGSRLGPLRAAICCHGVLSSARTVSRRGPAPLAAFQKTVAVNLVGAFNVLRLAAAEISRQEPDEEGERGVVVLTASIAAYDGQRGQIAYAASKGGVVAMTLPAARDLAPLGIRVVSIAPGIFETPMLGELSAETRAAIAAEIPFPPRPGRPQEFAQLAGDIIANRKLNGTTIRLDGGLRLSVG
jgi:NAD(P)-dependent dehydrogenase (short-subunit alcohol dehydrogenase family)